MNYLLSLAIYSILKIPLFGNQTLPKVLLGLIKLDLTFNYRVNECLRLSCCSLQFLLLNRNLICSLAILYQ